MLYFVCIECETVRNATMDDERWYAFKSVAFAKQHETEQSHNDPITYQLKELEA
jgi:hypothetical protein